MWGILNWTFKINIFIWLPHCFVITDDPVIDYQYYSDPHDAKVMVEGIRLVKALLETKAFAKYGYVIGSYFI